MSNGKGVISADEFGKRLAALCLKRGGGGMPKRQRDQHILLKSIALMLNRDTVYAETELNLRIQSWLDAIGQEIQIDHVSLRRHLVDEGYVVRDPAGANYRPVSDTHSEMFDPSIDELTPHSIIDDAMQVREERKRRFLNDGTNADR